MMDYQVWLDLLEEGDKVALLSYGGWGRNEPKYTITRVTRITPTRRITVSAFGGLTYDKEGRPYGRTDRSKLIPIDQTVLDAIDRENLLCKLYEMKLKDLSLDQLVRIDAIVFGGK